MAFQGKFTSYSVGSKEGPEEDSAKGPEEDYSKDASQEEVLLAS